MDPYAKLVLDLADRLPPVAGSREHLEDVWMNLLINARDALKGRATSPLPPSALTEVGDAVEEEALRQGQVPMRELA